MILANFRRITPSSSRFYRLLLIDSRLYSRKGRLRLEKKAESVEKEETTLITKNLPVKNAKISKKSAKIAQNLQSSQQIAQEMFEKRWATRVTRSRAYLHACLYSDDVASSLKFLNSFLYNSPQKIIQENVDLFNIVLLHLARENDVKKSDEILEKMKAKHVQPDLSTISALLLLAVNNTNDEVNVKLVEKALRYGTEESAFTETDVRRIFSHRVHGLDETRKILLALKAINPEFRPAPFALNSENGNSIEKLQYDCKLLRDFQVPASADDFSTGGPYDGVVFDGKTLLDKFTRQMKRELDCRFALPNVAALAECQKKSNDPDFQSKQSEANKMLNALTHEWRVALSKGFSESMKQLKQLSNHVTNEDEVTFLRPFLKCLPFNDYVDIMCDSVWVILTSTEAQHMQISYIKSMLGRTVYQKFVNRVQLDHKMDEKVAKIYERYSAYFVHPDFSRLYNQRQFWLKSATECYPEQPGIRLHVPLWPSKTVMMKVGEYLLDIMLKEVKIDAKFREKLTAAEVQAQKLKPLFYKVFCDAGSELREHLRVDPYFAKFLQSSTSVKSKLLMEAVMSPMLCPPIPWHEKDRGFYLCTNVDLIRTPAPFGKYADKVQAVLQKHENRKFYPALDTLNQLGNTPWIVNERVLDTALKIFGAKTGDTQLSIPADVSTLPVPPRMAKKGSSDFVSVLRQRRELNKLRNETYSLWMTALYKLSLANYFRNDVIWFPHSLDFRGRAYPCPPHLNHMGDDLNRGILLFARGQKLGRHGLDWLKIHCVNLTGLKKREPLKARLEYANEILSDILDSADDPLNGRQWWRKSEEPWQTLAVCIEIANAVRSPNVEEYVSRCPVHQDGSCNGLQHYAALGRDELGAKQVNLIQSETPQDVYSCVAAFVEEKRRLDAELGVEAAKICEGFVKRKVIKQTVMTIVYGVTAYGARLQIERQLKAIPEFPQEHAHRAAHYLSKSTFASIGALFNNTRKIQDWLANVATLVSGECRKPVEWVTPLDFPVLQPYFCRRSLALAAVDHVLIGKSTDQSATSLSKKSNNQKQALKKLTLILPEKRKQRNGFPPNFIHSLDSSHMMLTALHCQRLGISYASVHDCFWTHASTVDVMNKICRQQFVSLHNEPILSNLSEHLLNHVVGINNSDDQSVNGSNDDSHVTIAKTTNGDKDKNFPPLKLRAYCELLARVASVIAKVPQKGSFKLEEVLKSTYFFS